MTGERTYTIEIDVDVTGFMAPEQWMRDRKWSCSLAAIQNSVADFQFIGSKSETIGSNVWGRELYRYRFRDPRKARLFMLVWNGERAYDSSVW